MSEGLDVPWLHQKDLIISDKDMNGLQWGKYENLVINNFTD